MAAPSENMLDFEKELNEMCGVDFTKRHLEIIQNLSKAFREQDFRASAEKAVLQNLMKALTKLSEEIHALKKQSARSEPMRLHLQLTAECFRSQRNAAVHCTRNQCLMRELGFIQVSLSLLEEVLSLHGEDTEEQAVSPIEALRCGIQFLGNLAVGNQVCKDDIWKHCFPRPFLDLMEHGDEKTAAYASMVLYTCLNEQRVQQLVLDQEHQSLAMRVIGLCQSQPELDWVVLIVTQHFLKSAPLVEMLFVLLKHQERLTLLELITAQLGEEEEGGAEGCQVPPRLARFLASQFQERCKAVLSLTSQSAPDEEAQTAVRLLDILCEMTSDHKKLMFLQDHPGLLEATVELLREVHAAGKAGRNVFSPAQDFSTGAGPASHPFVSFKAHLVRLIGNLCHAHTDNQDKVREMDGLALILDNCNLDSNNPFISQWAVFAIRNLLEHNMQNQEVVRSLERRGVADDSTLRDMGFRLEERDGTLMLKPLLKDSDL